MPLSAIDFPIQLTQAQISDYKGKGWTVLPSTDTRDWRKQWGVWESIRDLIQNALDETGGYELRRSGSDVFITDDGAGIPISGLLKGMPEDKGPCVRGGKGEGMKVGMMGLIRAGYPVAFETAGRGTPFEGAAVWTPSALLGQKTSDVFSVIFRPGTRKHGTVIRIRDFKGPLEGYYERIAVGARAPRPVLSLPAENCKNGTDMLFEQPAGKLYSRDLWVQDIKSEFSYNLWLADHTVLGEDRNSVKNWDLMYVNIGRLWANIDDVRLMRKILRVVEDTPGSKKDTMERQFSFSEWIRDPITGNEKHYTYLKQFRQNAPAWVEAFHAEFGPRASVSSPYAGAKIVGLLNYYKVRRVMLAGPLRAALADDEFRLSDEKVLEDLGADLGKGTRVLELGVLEPEERKNLGMLRVINETMAREVGRPHPPVNAGVFEGLEGKDVRGICMNCVGTGRDASIVIERHELGAVRTAIDVYIHEFAHYYSGADDGEARHNLAISAIGSLLTELVYSGKLTPGVFGVERRIPEIPEPRVREEPRRVKPGPGVTAPTPGYPLNVHGKVMVTASKGSVRETFYRNRGEDDGAFEARILNEMGKYRGTEPVMAV